MSGGINMLFEHTANAVFGIDKSGQVNFWNGACEKLLGYSKKEVHGKRCYNLLCGNDIRGNVVCQKGCMIPKTLTNSNPINDFDLVIKKSSGKSILVNIGAYYNTDKSSDNEISVYFSMRHIDCVKLIHRISNGSYENDVSGTAALQYKLTSRETRILELAADGMKTEKIADHLSISIQTVRNHFKNIYPKLNVHSRAEAVCLVLRENLI